MTDATHPWDQQIGEPAKWYANFLLYRDMGVDRTMSGAYARGQRRSANVQSSGTRKLKSPSYSWVNAAEQWNWKGRAEAWDIYQRKEVREREIKRQRAIDDEWKRRQLQHRNDMWDMGTQMLSIAKDMMQSSLYTKVIEQDEQGKSIIKLIPAKWSFRDIPALVKLSDELRRQATGAEVDHLKLLHELREIGWIDDQVADEIDNRISGVVQHGRRAIAASAAELITTEEMEAMREEPDGLEND